MRLPAAPRVAAVVCAALAVASLGVHADHIATADGVSFAAPAESVPRAAARRGAGLRGLVAAPFTPFTPTGALNLPVVAQQLAELVKSGVMYAFVAGTTGEGYSMTVQERMQVAEAWVNASAGVTDFGVIVHVGAEALEDAQALAAHAEAIGAVGIAAMAPVFFKPPLPALVSWCAAIAAAAPRTPFYYYHIPSMAGAAFMMEDFLTLAQPTIPTLAGLKYTDYNLFDYSRCVHFQQNGTAHGPFTVLLGKDEVLLAGLALQGDGGVGSTYNYLGATANRLVGAFQAGNLGAAQLEQTRIQAVVKLLGTYGNAAAGKVIMQLKGIDVGPPRLPNTPLSAAQVQALQQDLESIGFFEWSN